MIVLRSLILILAYSLLGAAPKALWVWEKETLRLLDDRAFEAQVVGLLQTQGVRNLYLYADDYRGRNPILNERKAYRALLRRLHAAGIASAWASAWALA